MAPDSAQGPQLGLATIGYRVIHALGRFAGVVCAVAFVCLGIRLLGRIDLGAVFADRSADLTMSRSRCRSPPPGGDALTVYGIGILVQPPFLVTDFHTGPLVDPLGGADISWIVGPLVPALLSWLPARRAACGPPQTKRGDSPSVRTDLSFVPLSLWKPATLS